MKSSPFLLFLALLAAATAVWWFGLRDEQPLGEREFVARASAACEQVRAKRAELTPPARLEDLPEFADRSNGLIGEFRDDLGALEPPAERRAELDSLLRVLDETRDALNQAKQAAEHDDEEGVARAFQAVSGERSAGLFKALGVPRCVDAGTPPG